jgi:hypothetical protein
MKRFRSMRSLQKFVAVHTAIYNCFNQECALQQRQFQAYDKRKCHDAIATRNAHTVIPPRKKPSRGSLTHREPGHEMMPSDPRSIWAADSGET